MSSADDQTTPSSANDQTTPSSANDGSTQVPAGQESAPPPPDGPATSNPTLQAEADRQASVARDDSGADADQRSGSERPATAPGDELKSEGTDEDVPVTDTGQAAQSAATETEAEAPPTAKGADPGPPASPAGDPSPATGPDATAPEQPEVVKAAGEGDIERATTADVPTAAEPLPEPEPQPVDEVRQALLEQLVDALGDGVVEHHIRVGDDLWVRVRPDVWRQAAQVCRDVLGLTYFNFLSAVDWLPSPFGKSEDGTVVGADEQVEAAASIPSTTPGYAGGETRFQLLARLYSTTSHLGIFLKCDVADPEVGVDSWTPVYAGADWHEREVREMYGIRFAGHPHLVNIYLPSDFEGFPLRKDFPLLAREVKPWPGIVDVEPMPGEEPSDEEATAGAEGGTT